MRQTPVTSFQKTAQQSAAVYLEPRFKTAHKTEAGFHLAFAYAHLDGMTGVSQ
jgi:hypothetical protein